MRFQYWTVNCLVFSLVSYTAFGCKQGDLQTAATTALISGCVGVGPVYFLQVSQFIPVLCLHVFALLVGKWHLSGPPGPGSSGYSSSPGPGPYPIPGAWHSLSHWSSSQHGTLMQPVGWWWGRGKGCGWAITSGPSTVPNKTSAVFTAGSLELWFSC